MAAPAVPAAQVALLMASDVGLMYESISLLVGGAASLSAIGGVQRALSDAQRRARLPKSAYVAGLTCDAVGIALGIAPIAPMPVHGAALLGTELLDLDDPVVGVIGHDIFGVAALYPPGPPRNRVLHGLKCAMAKQVMAVLLPEFHAVLNELSQATLNSADATVLGNVAARTINLSADPAQDPGIVLKIHRARKAAMVSATLTTTGSGAAAVAVAAAAGAGGGK